MTPTTPPPGDDREQLRQQWLAAANDAFERMFAAAEQDQLITFLPARELVPACSATNSPPGCSNAMWPATRRPGPPTSRPPAAPSVAGRPAAASRLPTACRAGNCRRRPGRWSSNANSGGVRPVGSLFFPLDQRLQLGTEGYSPSLLQKIVRQGGKAPSFREAAEDLQELAGVTISPAPCPPVVRTGRPGVGRAARTGGPRPINKTGCRGATRRRPSGGRDARRRPLPGAGRRPGPGVIGGRLEGDEGGLLSNAVVGGAGPGPTARAAAEVPGADGGGPAGVHDEDPAVGRPLGEAGRRRRRGGGGRRRSGKPRRCW